MQSEIRLPARLENLGEFLRHILSAGREAGLDETALNHLELCSEEALVNVFSYAYPEGSGDALASCREEGGLFHVDIVDSGVPFDATSGPDPDTVSDLSERNIGGLGIFFIKKLMDEIHYRREDGRNILTLVLKKEGQDRGLLKE